MKQPPWFRGKPKKYENTSIELRVQNFLKKEGILFQTQYPILGKPDIFIPPNILILVDGCLWHKCKKCGYGVYGRRKDKYFNEKWKSIGYVVLRFWEHDINNNFRFVKEVILNEVGAAKNE